MINGQAADFVGFHCHSPAQWATMLVLVRRGTRRLAFCDAMERNYFSFHFDDVSQPYADLSGQDGANAITSESNVNAKLGEDSRSDKCLHWARFMENCVIFMSEAGSTAQPWIHCVSKVVMARQQRNSSENSFELYPDLRHRLTDVSAKRGACRWWRVRL
jgi:hypothetical protein